MLKVKIDIFGEIPPDIFDLIISNLNDMNPKFLYKLRIINKLFKNHIDNIKIENINRYNLSNIFNKLSYEGFYTTFKWLFDNNLYITLNNINNLISNDRENIIKLLTQYDYLKNKLYNNYNCNSHDIIGNDIISLSKSNNPLMLCAKNLNCKLTTIKILLDNSVKNNPYIKQLPGLFNTCIKYNNVIVIKYLVTYYYDKIKNIIWKINTLILNTNDIEDLLYYLIITKKIVINELLIINLIKKKYNDLCIYCFNNNPELKSNNNIINDIIKTNNIRLFNFIKDIIFDYSNIIKILLNESNKYDPNISYYYTNHENYKIFIENIINLDLNKINKDNKLIKLCLLNNIKNETIINLINEKYHVEIEDISIALQNRNIILVELLSRKFNNI